MSDKVVNVVFQVGERRDYYLIKYLHKKFGLKPILFTNKFYKTTLFKFCIPYPAVSLMIKLALTKRNQVSRRNIKFKQHRLPLILKLYLQFKKLTGYQINMVGYVGEIFLTNKDIFDMVILDHNTGIPTEEISEYQYADEELINDIQQYEVLLYNFVDKILIPSDYLYSKLENKFSNKLKRISYESQSGTVREEYSGNHIERPNGSAALKVLLVGSVNSEKGLRDLARIEKEFCSKNVNFTWVGRIEENITEFTNVKFVGARSRADVMNYYKNSDLLLHLGKVEGFSRTIDECRKFNLPVIGYTGCGLSSYHDKIAILIDNGDINELIAQLGLLINNRKILKIKQNNYNQFVIPYPAYYEEVYDALRKTECRYF